MAEVKRLAVLGSTGSIGTSTLDVVERNPQRFQVVALAAATSVEKLAAQAARHRPRVLAVKDAAAAESLRRLLPDELARRVTHGPQGYLAATLEGEPDLVLSAMVGAAGLVPTYAAVEAGIDVALANKESLVAGGELVMSRAEASGARIIPVDSEHSALFQALMGNDPAWVKTLWLTASGGPFRDLDRAALARVTAADALRHPTWSMGPKITIDSATLMNKGLEVIEAHWLFRQPFDKIKVMIHPQSLVHSLVEYRDGSIIAQLGPPDMRLPIAFALGYPRRRDWGLPGLDLAALGGLSFQPPDLERFPALGLAYEAGRLGGTAGAVLNAANEVAVERFLAGGLDYLGIAACVQAVLEAHQVRPAESVAAVLDADLWARQQARHWLERKGS